MKLDKVLIAENLKFTRKYTVLGLDEGLAPDVLYKSYSGI